MDIQIETHQHELLGGGMLENGDVKITFDNGPFDGFVIIPSDLFDAWVDQRAEERKP